MKPFSREAAAKYRHGRQPTEKLGKRCEALNGRRSNAIYAMASPSRDFIGNEASPQTGVGCSVFRNWREDSVIR